MAVVETLVLLLATPGCVVLAYLFPVQADMLILFNLILLTLAGLLLGYMSAMFEGDGVLSNVLCNRPRRAVQWSGGLLELMKAVGVHP
jgi:hypothetical protein